jgi:hypothetical protein
MGAAYPRGVELTPWSMNGQGHDADTKTEYGMRWSANSVGPAHSDKPVTTKVQEES